MLTRLLRVFRLLNVIGNILLMFEYDLTKHHRPKIYVLRRVLVNPLLSGLIYWTYPQSAEQKYPPNYS
jgi:hypothetical protein